ncbi:shikimate kinase [Sinanaerobacter chloroacetimidivorans]|jgi:shikimate kinase|uniref:Shikimate kinase n=1 Tax=Sinanaerobacter chloroacetimidivorans TaxID=2818044 RepID=A0A8J8B1S1_9FIRM|nr:shikimate kinase [Sinanaerobacter chloroacetimidivorans]MBR0597971.1 shikimate kinase [Sinanaerobacter chloroacetimidivorans]
MKNIVLIGMPGCGKSTIGVVLAKVMGYQFIDSDLLIQEQENRLLSEIIQQEGIEGFNEIENKVNASIRAKKAVIATGGSVIYGKEATKHLRDIGVVVYISLPYEEIESRLGDLVERGITIQEGQTLRDLYQERCPLYEEQAHIMINTQGLEIRDSVKLIKEKYEQYVEQPNLL